MKKLSESIFNAGIKRNQGDELREEDSVNQMSPEKFIEYLVKKYTFNGNSSFIDQNHEWISVIIDNGYFIDIRYDDDIPGLVQLAGRAYIKENAPDLLDILRQDYVIADHLSSAFRFTIQSKITNKDILKIIDTMIECCKKELSIHRN